MACGLIPVTPNDFPTPPMTIIVEIPFTPVPTVEPRAQPISSADMEDARTFLLILKTQITAGDDYGFAEKVHYPVQAVLDGQVTTFTDSESLAMNFQAILTDKLFNMINEADENDLLLLPDGIRVGHGELWINLFCVDAACSDTQFLITQINN